MGRTHAKAVPGFGDDDAVGRIMRIVAYLDREIRANIVDMIREQRDILGALVTDPGDAVVVDDQQWSGRSVVLLQADVDDAAVGNPARRREQVAPPPFHLFGAGPGPSEEIPGNARSSGCARCDGGEIPR